MSNSKIKEIAKKITERQVADVGSDHGYLIKELFDLGKIDQAWVVEINKKPLENAQNTLKEYHQTKYFLSDGLTEVSSKELAEIDAIVIAGMGGEQIKQILTTSDAKITDQKLYLQPSGSQFALRDYLAKNNFRIDEEEIIKDRDKFYELIICIKSEKPLEYTELDIEFGPQNLRNKQTNFFSYIQINLKYQEDLLKKIPRNSNNYSKIRTKIKQIKKILKENNETK